MCDQSFHPDPRIDAYLDQELSPEEAKQFEEQLRTDPDLRATVDALRNAEARVQASLHTTTVPNTEDVLSWRAPLAAEQPNRPRSRFTKSIRPLACAAAITLLAIGVFIANRPETQPIDGSALYARFAPSFEPDIICDTPDKFADYVNQTFGGGLSANFDTGVAFVGWSSLGSVYTGLEQTQPRVLIARSPQDEPAIVIVVPAGGPNLSVQTSNATLLRSKRAGNFKLFELSQSDKPIILNALTSDP